MTTTDKSKETVRSAADKTDALPLELKSAREAKNLTFSDLSRATGISRTALHDYESGRSKPGARELVKLCEALQVTPNRLLLGSENPIPGTSGVLVALLNLSREKPEKALALSMMLLPLMSAVLKAVGNETLLALATIADETVRARDPETFLELSRMVSQFGEIDAKAVAGMNADEKKEFVTGLEKKILRPSKTKPEGETKP